MLRVDSSKRRKCTILSYTSTCTKKDKDVRSAYLTFQALFDEHFLTGNVFNYTLGEYFQLEIPSCSLKDERIQASNLDER